MSRYIPVALACLAGIASALPPYSILDFNGDGKADIATKNDIGYGEFHVDFSTPGGFDAVDDILVNTSYIGSGPDEMAAPADYDGDGLTDLAIKTNYDWRIDWGYDGIDNTSNWDYFYSDGSSADWGDGSCQPVPADYDGDGKHDLSVYCMATFPSGLGKWIIDYSGNGFTGVDAGLYNRGFWPTRHALPADYDGDGKADLSIKDDVTGLWWVDSSTAGFDRFSGLHQDWGDGTYLGAPADYDGDGKADLAVARPDWYYTEVWIDYSGNGFDYYGMSAADVYATPNFYTGSYSPSFPIASDYDGDGYADFAMINTNGDVGIDSAHDGWGTVGMYYGYNGTNYHPLHKDARRASEELKGAIRLTKPEVAFTFDLPADARVEIEAFSVGGGRLATLFTGELKKGANIRSWAREDLERKGLKRGLYFLRLTAGKHQLSKRLALTE